MYQQNFGLTHAPLLSSKADLFDNEQLAILKQRFQWLIENPGIALLTGESGVGKTAALRHLANQLNPHNHQVFYQSENDFSRLDIYRQFALELGVEPAYRRAQLWRNIKSRITELVDEQQVQPIWILDEAQNLPYEFFYDLPSFLNYAFDSRQLLTIWLVGFPSLATLLKRPIYAALYSRLQVQVVFQTIQDSAQFKQVIEHAIMQAGCHQTILSDSAIETIRLASKGRLRQAGQIIRNALRIATAQKMNHLTDDVVLQAIEERK